VDTDDQAHDNGGWDCAYYSANPSECAKAELYDSGEFSASSMCCACGGGAAKAVEAKGWLWLEFKPTRVRAGPIVRIAQIAEIKFKWHGHPVDLTTATASSPGGNSPFSNGPENAIDGKTATVWVDHNEGALWIQLAELTNVDGLSFVTASDRPARDPVQWTLKGSRDGVVWTVLHQQTTDYDTPLRRTTSTPWMYIAEGSTCRNMDDDAVDDHGYDCFTYSMYPSGCGVYDDEDFTASEMCCACGGGSAKAQDVQSLSTGAVSTTSSENGMDSAQITTLTVHSHSTPTTAHTHSTLTDRTRSLAVSTTTTNHALDEAAISDRSKVIGGAIGGSLGAVTVGLLGGLLGGLLTTPTPTTVTTTTTMLAGTFLPVIFVNQTQANLRQASVPLSGANLNAASANDTSLGAAEPQLPALAEPELEGGFHASWWTVVLALVLLVSIATLLVGFFAGGNKTWRGKAKTRHDYVDASPPSDIEGSEFDTFEDSVAARELSPVLRQPRPRRTVVDEVFDALDRDHSVSHVEHEDWRSQPLPLQEPFGMNTPQVAMGELLLPGLMPMSMPVFNPLQMAPLAPFAPMAPMPPMAPMMGAPTPMVPAFVPAAPVFSGPGPPAAFMMPVEPVVPAFQGYYR
jgi:hypothetical protein